MALLNPFRLLSAGLALVATAVAGTYQRVDNFGSNPSNVTMYIYVPSQLAAKPPVLVFPHWCHGTAQAAYSGSQYATLSEKYGFVVIYPDSPNTADQCWDVSSNATLTHNAGGDSYGIVSMVKYALNKYNGDPDRVFVTGISSGAMMTNVLIGAYPDIFAGGSAFAGVPFGCFAGPSVDYWNSDCATGLITKTGAEWAKIVKAAYPGYTGWRPKMQVWHGTVDQVLNYTNFLEEIKEWTTVLGLGQTPTSVTNNTPVAGITKYSYDKEGRFEAYSAAGVDHNIANQENVVMAYFDLTCTGDKCYSRSNPNGNGTVPGSGGGASSSVTAAPTSTVAAITNTATATTAPTGVVKWGQCGGIGYTGPTNCLSGTCNYMNDWYSQCY